MFHIEQGNWQWKLKLMSSQKDQKSIEHAIWMKLVSSIGHQKPNSCAKNLTQTNDQKILIAP